MSKMGAIALIGRNAYFASLEAEMTPEEAKRAEEKAKAKARAELAVGDPVRQTINDLGKRLQLMGRETKRLRREREALIIALADALGVDEPTALQIARLDVEEDETADGS